MQVPITEKQLATKQMIEEVSQHVGMNYPEIPETRYLAQPVEDFNFPWEEERSVENPITIEEDEVFSEPRTRVSEPPGQSPALEARPPLPSIENLQSFENSTARQLFDF